MKLETVKSEVASILTITGDTREKLHKVRKRTPAFLQPLIHLLIVGWHLLFVPPIRIKDPNRRITVSADMFVEDDETFGSNETTRRQKTNSAILSQKGIAQTVMNFEVRMGGEIESNSMLQQHSGIVTETHLQMAK